MSHIFGKGESFILQLCCCYTLKKKIERLKVKLLIYFALTFYMHITISQNSRKIVTLYFVL